MVRRRYVFSGRVQGVGFRYRARHAAELLGVTGWVRNDWDDTVTMEVQGDEAAIRRMIEMIGNGTFVMITGMDVRELPPEEGERGFRVKGY